MALANESLGPPLIGLRATWPARHSTSCAGSVASINALLYSLSRAVMAEAASGSERNGGNVSKSV